jgi:hypothetical protein
MSFVKALYGGVIGENLSLKEGQIGYTDFDWHFKELEKRGTVKLFATYEEADAYQYIPSSELFNKSYKTLNPPEGEVVPPSLINWETGDPTIIDGQFSNQPSAPVAVTEEAKTPEVKTPKVETAKAPATDPLTPAVDADKK